MVYCWNLRKSLKYRPTNFINLFHVGTFLGSFDLMSIGMDKKITMKAIIYIFIIIIFFFIFIHRNLMSWEIVLLYFSET